MCVGISGDDGDDMNPSRLSQAVRGMNRSGEGVYDNGIGSRGEMYSNALCVICSPLALSGYLGEGLYDNRSPQPADYEAVTQSTPADYETARACEWEKYVPLFFFSTVATLLQRSP